MLIISSFDGVELMSGSYLQPFVHCIIFTYIIDIFHALRFMLCAAVGIDEYASDSTRFEKQTVDGLVLSYVTSIIQVHFFEYYNEVLKV
jgi:hypothetical protein